MPDPVETSERPKEEEDLESDTADKGFTEVTRTPHRGWGTVGGFRVGGSRVRVGGPSEGLTGRRGSEAGDQRGSLESRGRCHSPTRRHLGARRRPGVGR